MDILVTKRLTLRPPLEVDIDAVAEALANPNVAKWLTRIKPGYGRKEAAEWIAASSGKPCLFTIHREKLIGAIEVHEAAPYPVLGYWLAEPAWGNGYMSEAGRAVLAHAFRKFGAEAIVADAIRQNTASLRVMEKLGFQANGHGTRYIPTRGEGYPTIKTRLDRAEFEARFGALETADAA